MRTPASSSSSAPVKSHTRSYVRIPRLSRRRLCVCVYVDISPPMPRRRARRGVVQRATSTRQRIRLCVQPTTVSTIVPTSACLDLHISARARARVTTTTF